MNNILNTQNSRFGVVFARTLRENRFSILAWGIGFSLLILAAVLLYPLLQRSETLLNVLEGMGVLDRFQTAYGVDARAVLGFKGYLAFQVLAWVPLLLALYVAPQAFAAVQGEEDRHTLDVLLSAPIPRWQFLTEKVLAMITGLAGTLVMMWVTLAGCALLFPDLALTFRQASGVIWHIAPITLTIGMIALLVSVLTRRTRTAAGLIAGFVLGSFFVRAIADSSQAPPLLFLEQFSIFNYHSSITILSYGIQPQWDAVLLGVALVAFVLAVTVFQRRDLY